MIVPPPATAPALPILPAGDLSGAATLPGAPPAPSPAAGWTARGGAGFGWPAAGPVRLNDNTTLVSPPVDVPAAAQGLGVSVLSRGALVQVRAEPVDGSPAVALATLAPAATWRQEWVPAYAVAGRQVRIVLDPVGALGESVDVAGVGPFATVLPGWSVTFGVAAAPTRGPLVVSGEPLLVTSPAADAGPYAVALLVRARGEGVMTLRTGRPRASRRLTGAWTDVRVPVPPAARPAVRLELAVDPQGGVARIARIGDVVRRPAVTMRAVPRGRGRAVVTGRIVGCRPARVDVVGPGVRRAAAVTPAGTFRVVVAATRAGRLTATTRSTRLCEAGKGSTRLRRAR